MRTALHRKHWFGRMAGATAALALMGAALTTGLGNSGPARADVPSCSAATFVANAEAGAGLAFVDVGAGNTATFVCINSSAFAAGQSQPITTNGSLANGCYFVDGLGTSVVSVFWERPDIRPDCQVITSIRVSTVPVTGATPTVPVPMATSTTVALPPVATPITTNPGTIPTAAPTGTSGGTIIIPQATSTPVPPPNTPVPATPRPNTPVPAATQAPAQPTVPAPAATQQVPRPPATGTGTANPDGSNLPLFVALGLLAVGVSAGGFSIVRQRSR